MYNQMFNNKIREYARGLQGVVKRFPGFISNTIQTVKRGAETAAKVGQKLQQIEGVYDRSKDVIGTSKYDQQIKKTFGTANRGIQRIQDIDKGVSKVGGDVLTLF
jgi:hypothetical protein